MAEPLILAVQGHAPQLHPDSWVAPNAAVIGKVTVAENVGVWYSATLRAEFDPIVIGAGSNVQDSATVHTDPGFPTTIGAGVTIGHNAVVHGCTIEEGVLIGMGSTVLNGATIGAGSVVAAGAVVPEGMTVPPRSLVAGVPAKIRRELSADEVTFNRMKTAAYEYLLGVHRDATPAVPEA